MVFDEADARTVGIAHRTADVAQHVVEAVAAAGRHAARQDQERRSPEGDGRAEEMARAGV